MGSIIRERDNQDKIDGKKAFLFIIGLIMAINVIVAVINKLESIAAGVASLFLMLAVMALTYRVITRRVTEYNYVLTDEGIIFERVIGKSEKPLLDIPFDEIISLTSGDPDRQVKTYYFLCNRKNNRRQTLMYSKKGKEMGVVFCPSPNMAERIQQRIKPIG
jgi:hypothetical protein